MRKFKKYNGMPMCTVAEGDHVEMSLKDKEGVEWCFVADLLKSGDTNPYPSLYNGKYEASGIGEHTLSFRISEGCVPLFYLVWAVKTLMDGRGGYEYEAYIYTRKENQLEITFKD